MDDEGFYRLLLALVKMLKKDAKKGCKESEELISNLRFYFS